MAVVVVCGLMVVLGLVAVVRWGGETARRPPGDEEAGGDPSPPSPGLVARRYVWYLTVAVVSGVGAGLLVAGAGGRLAMRLLAATAGDAAQGRVTEADEVVGRISVGGTVGFMIFTALFFGFATGVLYLVIRRWLPPGRWGGSAFGALLLVVAATRVEPLRGDNPDFDIVGPGWVAIAAFASLVVVHGMLVAAIAGRFSRTLPLPSAEPRDLLRHTPLAVLLPFAPVLVPITAVGAGAVVVSRMGSVTGAVRSVRATAVGRVVITLVALVSLPGAVSTVVDIAGRGP